MCKVKDHYCVKLEIYFQFGNFRDCHCFTSEVGHKKTPTLKEGSKSY